MKILLIEDHDDNEVEIRHQIQSCIPRATITRAKYRSDVDEIIRDTDRTGDTYDIITVDLRLPLKDGGLETYNELPHILRNAFPEAAIVVFSGYLNGSALNKLTEPARIRIVEKGGTSNFGTIVMEEVGKNLLRRLRVAGGHIANIDREGVNRRVGSFGQSSTLEFKRLVDEILPLFNSLPPDIKKKIGEYVRIDEKKGKLIVHSVR